MICFFKSDLSCFFWLGVLLIPILLLFNCLGWLLLPLASQLDVVDLDLVSALIIQYPRLMLYSGIQAVKYFLFQSKTVELCSSEHLSLYWLWKQVSHFYMIFNSINICWYVGIDAFQRLIYLCQHQLLYRLKPDCLPPRSNYWCNTY